MPKAAVRPRWRPPSRSIGPVNFVKCLRALDVCDGVVREVSDQEIMDGKAQARRRRLWLRTGQRRQIAGAKRLREEGVIAADDRVVCILTGHEPEGSQRDCRLSFRRGGQPGRFANRPIVVENDLEQIIAALHKFV